MSKYAKTTTVAVEKSKVQIQQLLTSWGIKEFFFATSIRGDGIGCKYNGRLYKWNIVISIPDNATEKQKQQIERQRWRILYMGMKMRLEEINSGNETFEDQFLAKMCLPNGSTVSDWIKLPENAALLDQTEMPKLLTGKENNNGKTNTFQP